MIHELKIKECYWIDIFKCRKTFEIRKNDRNYRVGDIIHFRPITEDGTYIDIPEKYNTYVITYVFNDGEYGIDKEYCVLGIREVVIFDGSTENEITRVRDLVSLLRSNPLDNALVTTVDGEETEYILSDVLIGGGTNKCITYLDIRSGKDKQIFRA